MDIFYHLADSENLRTQFQIETCLSEAYECSVKTWRVYANIWTLRTIHLQCVFLNRLMFKNMILSKKKTLLFISFRVAAHEKWTAPSYPPYMKIPSLKKSNAVLFDFESPLSTSFLPFLHVLPEMPQSAKGSQRKTARYQRTWKEASTISVPVSWLPLRLRRSWICLWNSVRSPSPWWAYVCAPWSVPSTTICCINTIRRVSTRCWGGEGASHLLISWLGMGEDPWCKSP